MPTPQAKPKILAPQAYAIAIIFTHLALSIAHGLAHGHLSIALTISQKIFVVAVTLAAPLVAGWLIWRRRLRLGGALLAISMAGALAFGVYYHFIAPGPDNVNQANPAAPANWRSLFEDTAMDLALLEGLGTVAGIVLVAKSARQNAPAETSE
ncbi:MAG TPA: hypothetical protein VLY23_03230 [Candidatus Acidoferrum sp.]|nr:hypothetical protein [Candidatus Acidoferrum sp.]